MKTNNIVIYGVGLIAVSSLVLAAMMYSGQKKTAYFDYNQVYNACNLKTDLEKDLEKVVSRRKSELDSMQLGLSMLSEKVKSGQASDAELVDFEDQKNRFLSFQATYENENIRLKEEYFTQIRVHINDKAKAYGEEMGFAYFFSAVGDGSLMYADESEDVSDAFLKFVNE